MTKLEFWPDYTGGLLWTADGERVSLEDLGLPVDVLERAGRWIDAYDDSKLPWEPTRDDAWLSDGMRLFGDLKRELGRAGLDLESNEPFWSDGPDLGRHTGDS